MMASHISYMLMCFLLLPHFAFSEHTHGRSHVFIHSSSVEARPRTVSPSLASDCSSIPSGPNNDKLPVVHPLSPCSHLSGARSPDMPSVDDMLHADRLRLQSFSETGTRSTSAASTSDSTPIAGNCYDEFPGTLFYTVVLGYGTPAQQFAVAFDTAAGFSYLRCKPCKAGDSPCSQAFDPSLSSSFAPITCSSPECAGPCSGAAQTTCPFRFGSTVTEANGTFVKDTLTFSPSAAVEGFKFGCTEFVDPELFYGAAGLVDLSRNNHSLASSPPSNGGGGGNSTIAFSYCLPSNLSSHGFLSVHPSRSVYADRRDVQYAPLVDNKVLPPYYFVELVGIKVGGVDLAIPPSAPINNFTLLDTATTFTYFVPSVYAVLREEFQRQMAKYPTAPPFNGLDTCYNFTGLDKLNEPIILPIVRLEFAGGSSLELEGQQVLYFTNPANFFSVACLAFGETNPGNTFPVSVIGTLAQRSAEMIYDVQGGKLGFAQRVC